MKNMIYGIILAAGFGTAQADFVPDKYKMEQASDLLDICTVDTSNSVNAEAYGFCVGYFTGAMHYHRALAKGPDHKAIACPEHTVTRAEAISVFVAWAHNNPQYLTEEPIEALMRAAVAKWPCKPGNQAATGGMRN
jgi:hypothetical protein